MRISGNNIYVFRENDGKYEVIANSDSCSLSISCATVPICCRGSLQNRIRRGSYTWAVDISGLYISQGVSLKHIVGQPLSIVVSVLWRDLSGAVSPQDIAPNSLVMLSGNAFVTSCQEDGARGGPQTWQMTMVGDGGLTAGTPAPRKGFPYIFPLVFV